MDLSRAYQAGARRSMPPAHLCCDGLHLVKLAHEALEAVRRPEAKHAPELKGNRWGTRNSA